MATETYGKVSKWNRYVKENTISIILIIVVLLCAWYVTANTGKIVTREVDNCNKEWEENIKKSCPSCISSGDMYKVSLNGSKFIVPNGKV